MASVGSTSAVSNVTVNQNDTIATIINYTLTLSNTEYSINLPNNTKKFLLKCRETNVLKINYSPTTDTEWFTIPACTTYLDENYYVNQTLYFQSPSAGVIIELVAFN